MIQNFSPSCLNRDDTNTPKDCFFGGFRRARISSQCLKRAIRKYFNEEIERFVGKLGVRTRFLPKKVIALLVEQGKDEETSTQIVADVLKELGFKIDEKHNKQTEVLLFINHDTPHKIAEVILENWDAFTNEKEASKAIKEKLKPIFKEIQTDLNPDIALFGRMVASKTDLNVDAACYVAHAFSTHKVEMEMDFFTAVDDLQEETESGAAHMGILMYNSSCFYRYAVLDINQLLTNLNGNTDFTISVIKAYIEAMINAIPTGKQSSMAAFNKPDFILANLHSYQPTSLANAYATPAMVGLKNENLIALSIKKLVDYLKTTWQLYDRPDDLSANFCLSDSTLLDLVTEIGTHCNSIKDLLNNLGDTLNARLSPSS